MDSYKTVSVVVRGNIIRISSGQCLSAVLAGCERESAVTLVYGPRRELCAARFSQVDQSHWSRLTKREVFNNLKVIAPILEVIRTWRRVAAGCVMLLY
jgi:hypothetical protein